MMVLWRAPTKFAPFCPRWAAGACVARRAVLCRGWFSPTTYAHARRAGHRMAGSLVCGHPNAARARGSKAIAGAPNREREPALAPSYPRESGRVRRRVAPRAGSVVKGRSPLNVR
jgi:hypothetical protein